jgi:superkiller protein 3
LLVLQGRLDDGIIYLKKAVEAQPDYAFAYYNLGKAYQEKRDFPNAIYNLMFALNFEPDDVYAINVLGRMFLDVGLNDRALRTFDQVLAEFDANDRFAMLGKADALEAMGNTTRAKEVLVDLKKIAGEDKLLVEKIEGRITRINSKG